MRALVGLFVLGLALPGCPPQPKPTPVPGTDMASPRTVLGVPYCDPSVVVHTADICDGYFVAHQIPCAQCPRAAGCLSGVSYCAGTVGCAADTLCKLEQTP